MTRSIGALLLAAFMVVGPMAAVAAPMPAAPALRDEAAVRLDLSKRFIAALQTDQMTTMMAQMSTSLTPARPGLSPERTEAVNRATAAAIGSMMPRMFDAMAPIYADIFTLEELTGLVNFYESDLGQSMMAKSYLAGPRISAVVMGMMPDVMKGMAEAVCKELACTAEERARIDASLAEAGYGGGSTAPAPAPHKAH